MRIHFEKMTIEHGKEFIDIFNYYVENSLSIFLDEKISIEGYKMLFTYSKGFPAYAIIYNNKTVGFCFLNAHIPIKTFNKCAEMSVYIHKDYLKKGIGGVAIVKLEKEGYAVGIRTILLRMSSENENINFKNKFGFKECGRFKNVCEKKGKQFDILWYQKDLNKFNSMEDTENP